MKLKLTPIMLFLYAITFSKSFSGAQPYIPKKLIQISTNSIPDKAKIVIKDYQIPDTPIIKIYDITRKQVQDFVIKTDQRPRYEIPDPLQSLGGGLYLLQVNNFRTIGFRKSLLRK